MAYNRKFSIKFEILIGIYGRCKSFQLPLLCYVCSDICNLCVMVYAYRVQCTRAIYIVAYERYSMNGRCMDLLNTWIELNRKRKVITLFEFSIILNFCIYYSYDMGFRDLLKCIKFLL